MTDVLSVASEIFPIIKTGGLADVTGALPAALLPHCIRMRSLIPGYPAVLQKLPEAKRIWQDPEYFGGPANLLSGYAAGLELLVLDAPHLFDRAGTIYLAPDGTDWPDNPLRFAALAHAAALIGAGAIAGYRPEILHLHDWQAGLAAAYLHYAGIARPATLLTVHNLGFQGIAPASSLAALRLPPHAFAVEGVEFYGSISLLKAGLQFADRITTVSPTYAAEICTPSLGMGMDGIVRARSHALSGIVNGIDTTVWDPKTDASLPRPFSAADPAGKQAAKSALQARFGFSLAPRTLLLGVVSRLTHQKGCDLLLQCLDVITASDAQLAVLGNGESALEEAFKAAAAAHPDRIAVMIGYDEGVAHLIQGGADAILVPSRFEPCGLTQLCALRYGNIPIVSRTGGLADTIIDANMAALRAGVATGIHVSPVTVEGLRAALIHAIDLFQAKPIWDAMMANAMATNVDWDVPAAAYAELYRVMLTGTD